MSNLDSVQHLAIKNTRFITTLVICPALLSWKTMFVEKSKTQHQQTKMQTEIIVRT